MNLGRNSIKCTAFGYVRLCCTIVNGEVELSVYDSGPGIEPSKRSKIFDKPGSTGVLDRGTALGMSLCHSLVEDLLGGKIFLDETYDTGIQGSPGSRFVIQLKKPPVTVALADLDECQDVDAVEDSSAERVSLSGDDTALPENLSVLIVDDDSILRRLFRRTIKKVAPSWTVSDVASGEAALDFVAKSKIQPDIIFCDQFVSVCVFPHFPVLWSAECGPDETIYLCPCRWLRRKKDCLARRPFESFAAEALAAKFVAFPQTSLRNRFCPKAQTHSY